MHPSLSTSPNRVRTPLRIDLPLLGTLRPKSVAEIGRSNWTLGCETLDRDFADWDAYRDYLAPLGLKSIRLQAGWAKCERVRGAYDFAWLDHIVDDAIALGLDPILETGYGNPVYPGGGGFDLGAGFPTSDEGLAAWDAWVDALARHFAGRVYEWFMWNEPDIPPSDGSAPKTPAQIAAFNVRTARIVKRNVPGARIAGLSLARNRPEFLEECLRALGPDAALFDWFVYHGYQSAPEASYENVEAQKEVVRRLAPHATLRQGENGAPSEMPQVFALRRKAWSEYSQAKWNLRRMLGDLGHGVPGSVFTICDFNHKGREINRKGLLRADEDHRVIAVKRAYYAVQNLVAALGGECAAVPMDGGQAPRPPAEISLFQPTSFRSVDPSLSAYAFSRSGCPDFAPVASEPGRADLRERPLFAFWSHGGDFVGPELAGNAPGLHAPAPDNRIMPYLRPGDSFETRPAVFEDFSPGAAPLRDPVWCDLLTGKVFAFPAENIIPCRTCVRYLDVPVYDSPCLLAERAALDFA